VLAELDTVSELGATEETLVTSVVGVDTIGAAADGEPAPPAAPQTKGAGPGMV